ncbi:probable peroxygenase 4 [Momordica charantia]|uniref:Probable peroxygenase 4 n=1 Tax=Momordica charantia TaxID=3673 RepID=A0A6J1DXH5_MOMCH|nr:probable peroxygenase 4 [Momordica charantia]
MADQSSLASSPSKEGAEKNVLQRHVAFFDRNHDGVVYPWETFKGFRAIGAGLLLSTVSAVFINVGLSTKTRPGKFPNLLFPIEIKNIHLAKHGSDSGVYDTEGRFVASKFEEIFKNHAKTYPDALTEEELKALLMGNREPKNYVGWFASYAEWTTLYNLCKDDNGLLQKHTVKAVYDGSLFEHMEKQRELTTKKK